MKKRWIKVLALSALLIGVPGLASADDSEIVNLTGIEDFDMAVVFRPLFASFPDRNPVIEPARWQINGDETGPLGTLGIFAVFDIDSSLLGSGADVIAIEGIEFSIRPAVNQDTGTGGIANAGDLSIYFTTSDADVLDPEGGIIFDNGGGSDPTGLGDQFENLTLLSSGFQEEGVYDIERLIIPAESDGLETLLLERIAAGENLRFLIASQTPGFTSNFGTGNEDQSPNFDFFGEPPEVTFILGTQVPVVTQPIGVPLLSPLGLALLALLMVAVTMRRMSRQRA
ncbi:MAG: hypothetical protein ACXIUB_01525 [Wenzhouxiangella sp.]